MTNVEFERLLRQLGKVDLTPEQREALAQIRTDHEDAKREQRWARAHAARVREQLASLGRARRARG